MYFGASIVFSMLHIAIMVGSRKLVYLAWGRSYDFGLSWFELIYEYQKDAIKLYIFYCAHKSISICRSAINWEASSIEESEQQATPSLNRLLVKAW
ncbi:hypothetical protein P4S68_00385 [Pseudoalteromonas sp. Hal099]